MLRSTDPVNPTRTVFDVNKLLKSLECRANVFDTKAGECAGVKRYDSADRFQLRADILRGLADRIGDGEFDTLVKEVPAPDPTTCDGGPVRECRCSPAQLVEILRARARTDTGIDITDIKADQAVMIRWPFAATVIMVQKEANRS